MLVITEVQLAMTMLEKPGLTETWMISEFIKQFSQEAR
jgi:hypothetical protein